MVFSYISNELNYLSSLIAKQKSSKPFKYFYWETQDDLNAFLLEINEVDILNEDDFLILISENFLIDMQDKENDDSKKWYKFVAKPVILENNCLHLFWLVNKKEMNNYHFFTDTHKKILKKNITVKFFENLTDKNFSKYLKFFCNKYEVKLDTNQNFDFLLNYQWENLSHLENEIHKLKFMKLTQALHDNFLIDYLDQKFNDFLEILITSENCCLIFQKYQNLLNADFHDGWIFEVCSSFLNAAADKKFFNKDNYLPNFKKQLINKISISRLKKLLNAFYHVHLNNINYHYNDEKVSFIVEVLRGDKI